MAKINASRLCWRAVLLLALGAGSVGGCTALREVANLRKVQFRIERVTQARLASVDLDEVRSSGELTAQQALRLGNSLSNGTLPLSFRLHLRATNPSSNDMDARLTEMDWTLLLDDEETVSGTFDQVVVLPPGEPTPLDFHIDLDLVRFFDENLPSLVDLASAISGEGPPARIAVRVRPTIQTRVGPIRYPSPVTVVSREVGQQSEP